MTFTMVVIPYHVSRFQKDISYAFRAARANGIEDGCQHIVQARDFPSAQRKAIDEHYKSMEGKSCCTSSEHCHETPYGISSEEIGDLDVKVMGHEPSMLPMRSI